LDIAALELAIGAKEFLQNPAYVLGVPLVVIGGLMLMLVLAPFK